MTPHCVTCQARPMPCLRLVLPQKQLLGPRIQSRKWKDRIPYDARGQSCVE